MVILFRTSLMIFCIGSMIMIMTAFSLVGIFMNFFLLSNNLFVETELSSINLDVVSSLLLLVLLLDNKNKINNKEHDNVDSERAESSSNGSSDSTNICKQVLNGEVLVLEHLFSESESEIQINRQRCEAINLLLIQLEDHSDVIFRREFEDFLLIISKRDRIAQNCLTPDLGLSQMAICLRS